jgi:ATPase subunit of ABC transporter with duplicated ATPase domains
VSFTACVRMSMNSARMVLPSLPCSVGRNGMGKTTLLRAMARHDIQGIGTQRFPTNIRVLHVEQVRGAYSLFVCGACAHGGQQQG